MGSKRNTYKPYVGSIRFYKHIILTILVLLIVVPILICIVLLGKQSRLTAEYKKQNRLVLEQAGELRKLQYAPKQMAGGKPINGEGSVYNGNPINGGSPDNGGGSPSGDKKANRDWKLMIVNERISLPENFTVNLADIGDGQFVDERIVTPLNQMMAAANAAGIHIRIYSSYRSTEKQLGLFNASVSQYLEAGSTYDQAFYKTKHNIALPSESEHQTGLMVDIIGLGQKELGNTEDHLAEGNTPEMKWLKENCGNYGFICRYPAGKAAITGINYEPYCFRYVGEEAAKFIMDNGITLEEYVQTHS